MAVQCPRCHAGSASLEAITEVLADGTTLQTVRCVACSWRTSRKMPAERVENPHRPMVNKNGPPFIRRPRDEVRPASPGRRQKAKDARLASVARHSESCAVHGCEGTYYAATASLPLCRKHRMRLRDWTAARRTTWPPVACVNGHWIERGHPLPAIPGERPAPVPVEEPKTHGVRPRKPRQGFAAIPAPSMPYEKLEADLERLAGLGNPSARALVAFGK